MRKSGNSSKNMILFEFLQKSRTDDDLDNIISALQTGGNTEALKMFESLKKGIATDLEGGSVSVSNRPPTPQPAEMVTRSDDELDACRLVEVFH